MIEDMDIVFLAKTWEGATCRILDIPRYKIHSAYQPHPEEADKAELHAYINVIGRED